MSQTVQSPLLAQVESVARRLPPAAQEDFRQLINSIVDNLTSLSPGGNLIQPGGTPANASKPPVGVTHSVAGENAQYTVQINNPKTPQGTQIYHEISYSPVQSFQSNETVTLPATTQTAVAIPSPGTSFFFRLRSSYDKRSWTNYQYSSATAGLIQSAAVSAGGAFNQTNFAEVNSQASGTAAAVSVSGPGGTLTSYTAVKGQTQQVRPSATIVGVPANSEQFVGYDGSTFRLKPTLASVLADNLEPVGKVSVVSTTPPTPPVIVPIVTAGSVLGYHVTSGGAGATQPYTLTVSGDGTGATCGAQVIQNGVLISVAPGDAGTGYTTAAVNISGGGPGGSAGGGTSVGGNGGRMTAV